MRVTNIGGYDSQELNYVQPTVYHINCSFERVLSVPYYAYGSSNPKDSSAAERWASGHEGLNAHGDAPR
jgi:hypothetical protein